jgi:hypothetical protein
VRGLLPFSPSYIIPKIASTSIICAIQPPVKASVRSTGTPAV